MERLEEKWPNFFIVGAERSGTTSLYQYLKDVPSVYMSPVKEPRYFLGGRDKRKYLKLFESVTDEIAIGEASPQYLTRIEASEMIYRQVPGAKIIIILRDPVERAFSGWYFSRRWNKLSFREVIDLELRKESGMHPDFVGSGLYSEHVRRFQEVFGKDRTRILIFEEFIHDVQSSMGSILEFLGVHSEAIRKKQYKTHNASSRFEPRIGSDSVIEKVSGIASLVPSPIRKLGKKILLEKKSKEPIKPEDRKFLEQVYREDVQNLSEILSRRLPWLLNRSS